MAETNGESRPVNLSDLRFGAGIAAIAILVGIGSFGTWSVLQPRRVASYAAPIYTTPDIWGIQRWRGPGWMTLALAILSLVFVLFAVARSTTEGRVIAVAFLAAVIVVTTYNLIDILFWYPSGTGISFTVGWGLWLCFSSAVVGVAMGTLWIHRVRTRPSAEV
jgi:hypothetical protein